MPPKKRKLAIVPMMDVSPVKDDFDLSGFFLPTTDDATVRLDNASTGPSSFSQLGSLTGKIDSYRKQLSQCSQLTTSVSETEARGILAIMPERPVVGGRNRFSSFGSLMGIASGKVVMEVGKLVASSSDILFDNLRFHKYASRDISIEAFDSLVLSVREQPGDFWACIELPVLGAPAELILVDKIDGRVKLTSTCKFKFSSSEELEQSLQDFGVDNLEILKSEKIETNDSDDEEDDEEEFFFQIFDSIVDIFGYLDYTRRHLPKNTVVYSSHSFVNGTEHRPIISLSEGADENNWFYHMESVFCPLRVIEYIARSLQQGSSETRVNCSMAPHVPSAFETLNKYSLKSDEVIHLDI
jgi:hypothetical protein